MLKPLTPEARRQAREAFNEVMNTHDEDPLAIAATVTVRSLLLAKKKSRDEEKERSTPKEVRGGR